MEVSENDLNILIEFLKRDYNIDFGHYAQSSFRRRIERILQLSKIDGVKMLVMKIKNEPSYLQEFVEEVTVNTTELFRDGAFWIYLRDNVIPLLRDFSTIRIWHAGCSSGEEVFSMAILLQEAGLLDKTKLIATDLNESVINRAMQGKYSMVNSLPVMEKNYQIFNPEGNFDQYYSVKGKFAMLNSDLIRNVEYKKHDLVKGDVIAKVNLVLCRNVLIYFDQELQDKVLGLFYESMFKDGVLAIGSKETLMLASENKKFAIFNEKNRIYKRAD